MNATSLLTAMTQEMRWNEQRQGVLAENVANADTPNYRAKDLKPIDFSAEVDNSLSLGPLVTATDDSRDFSVAGFSSDTGQFSLGADANTEVNPQGNGVSVEDEMMKVTANQLDYQAVTTLYSKSLSLIRTALGHPS